jgi:hypothetical protein
MEQQRRPCPDAADQTALKGAGSLAQATRIGTNTATYTSAAICTRFHLARAESVTALGEQLTTAGVPCRPLGKNSRWRKDGQ